MNVLDKRKVLIGGSKTIYDPRELSVALKIVFHNEIWLRSLRQVGMVISGGEKGVDRLGINFARSNQISVVIFTPKINKENALVEMVKQSNCGIILWDGKSVHTCFLIDEFQRQDKPFYVHYAIETACYKNKKDMESLYKQNSGG